MSFRFWVSIITIILVGVVVYFGWGQIIHAWHLIGSANLWLLTLLLPVQIMSYFASNEAALSYLRSKGEKFQMTKFAETRLALEANFVNHIAVLPMAVGSSYFSWSMNRYGVSVGRSTMSQIVKTVVGLAVFILMLFLSLFIVSFDFQIQKQVLYSILLFVMIIIFAIIGLIFIVSSRKRTLKLSKWVTKIVNKITGKFNKKNPLLKSETTENFFLEIHRDYGELIADKKVLSMPFLWSIVMMSSDALMLILVFWSIGAFPNPAVIFIAMALAYIGSTLAVTPGGAGVYEAVMVGFLISTGVSADVAIAGTLISRAILLTGTITFGYLFYQMTIHKYGKVTDTKI
jgi:uncharacterized protein (TIRG00374 family)